MGWDGMGWEGKDRPCLSCCPCSRARQSAGSLPRRVGLAGLALRRASTLFPSRVCCAGGLCGHRTERTLASPHQALQRDTKRWRDMESTVRCCTFWYCIARETTLRQNSSGMIFVVRVRACMHGIRACVRVSEQWFFAAEIRDRGCFEAFLVSLFCFFVFVFTPRFCRVCWGHPPPPAPRSSYPCPHHNPFCFWVLGVITMCRY